MSDGSRSAADTVEAIPVRVTLEDQLELQMRCLRSPAMRAGRLRREAMAVLLSPLYILVCGLAGVTVAWLGDDMRSSFGSSVLSLVRDEWPILVAACLGTMALTAAWIAFGHRLLRPRMRRVLRRVLEAHPGVDKSDPLLAFASEVSAGPEGLQVRNAASTMTLNWVVLTRWDEADGRLFVLGDALNGLCLPTTGADPARLDALRRLLTARLGPPTRDGAR